MNTPSEDAKQIAVKTQEAETGKWVSLVIYHPGNPSQMTAAIELTAALRHLGLYARVGVVTS